MPDNYMSAYAQTTWLWKYHHQRRKRFLDSLPKNLVCQECGGSGGEVVPVTDEGQGPFEECGFCEGDGRMTPHERSFWLLRKRQEKQKDRYGIG